MNESGEPADSRGVAAATGVNKEEPSAEQDIDDCDAAKGAGDSQCEVDAKDKHLRKQDVEALPPPGGGPLVPAGGCTVGATECHTSPDVRKTIEEFDQTPAEDDERAPASRNKSEQSPAFFDHHQKTFMQLEEGRDTSTAEASTANSTSTCDSMLSTMRRQEELRIELARLLEVDDSTGAANVRAEVQKNNVTMEQQIKEAQENDLRQTRDHALLKGIDAESAHAVGEKLRAKLESCLKHEDFHGAADMQRQLKSLAKQNAATGPEHNQAALTRSAQEEALRYKLSGHLRCENYLEAAKTKVELETLAKSTAMDHVSGDGDWSCKKRVKNLRQQIAACLARDDYSGASQLKVQLTTLVQERAATGPALSGEDDGSCKKREQELRNQIAACLRMEDYSAASQLAEQLTNVLRESPASGHAHAGKGSSKKREQEISKQIAACLGREDYSAAAQLKAQLISVLQESAAKGHVHSGEGDGSSKIREHEIRKQITACLVREDYSAASQLKEQLTSVLHESTATGHVHSGEGDGSCKKREQEIRNKIAACLASEEYSAASQLKEQLTSVLQESVATGRVHSGEGHGSYKKREHEFRKQIAACLEREDYSIASQLKEQLTSVLHESAASGHVQSGEGDGSCSKREQEIRNKIAACLVREEYSAASQLKEQLTSVLQESAEGKRLARAEHAQGLREKIAARLKCEDYSGAAKAKEELAAFQQSKSVAAHPQNDAAIACAVHLEELREKLQSCLDAEDYAGAAGTKRKLALLENGSAEGTTESARWNELQNALKRHKPANGSIDHALTRVSILLDPKKMFQSIVNLEGFRMLALSKVFQPSATGKGSVGEKSSKTKGPKGGGKDKSKQKGSEAMTCAYFGDEEGQAVCIIAYGSNAAKLPGVSQIGCNFDIRSAHAKPGIGAVLTIGTATEVILQLGLSSSVASYGRRPEDFTLVMSQLPTIDVGAYVTLLLKLQFVEDKYNSNGEAYLEVHGVDSEGQGSGAIRLWNYDHGELRSNTLCIMHGLKVAYEKYWDDAQHKYAQRSDQSKKLECSNRTAVQDVSEDLRLMPYFD